MQSVSRLRNEGGIDSSLVCSTPKQNPICRDSASLRNSEKRRSEAMAQTRSATQIPNGTHAQCPIPRVSLYTLNSVKKTKAPEPIVATIKVLLNRHHNQELWSCSKVQPLYFTQHRTKDSDATPASFMLFKKRAVSVNIVTLLLSIFKLVVSPTSRYKNHRYRTLQFQKPRTTIFCTLKYHKLCFCQ